MAEFHCPICNEEIEINEIDAAGINVTASSISSFHKQCKKCKGFLYFEPETKTFKKLSWWKRLFNSSCFPTMEVRERTR